MNTYKTVGEEIKDMKVREAKHKRTVLKAAFGGLLLGAGLMQILVADATVNPAKWTLMGGGQIFCGGALVLLALSGRIRNT